MWDVATGRWVGGGPGAITAYPDMYLPEGVAVAFSPDGRTLATGCGPGGANPGGGVGTLKLFDVATRAPIAGPSTSVDAPVSQVAFSPDGKILAVGSEGSDAEADIGGGTFLFDAATLRQLGNPLIGDGPVSSVAFSPDGATLASGAEQGGIQLWSVAVATGGAAGPPIVSGDAVTAMTVSPDGAIAAVGGNAGTVRLIDTATRRLIDGIITIPGGSAIDSLAFGPDGRDLAVGTAGGAVEMVTVATGQLTRIPVSCGTEPEIELYALAFSSDSKTLAIGCASHVQLWSGRRLGPPLPFSPGVNALAFSPGGTTLAIAGGSYASGGIVDLVVSGREVRSIPVPGGPVYSVAFNPDGTTLATGDDDGVARLWDVGSGQLTGSFTSSGAGQDQIAFSPDGRTLASGTQQISGANTAVQLFDLQTSQQVGTPLTIIGSLDAMAFSRDGRTITTGSGTSGPGILQRWDVSYLVDPAQFICALEGGTRHVVGGQDVC